jgi:hypothetical protein
VKDFHAFPFGLIALSTLPSISSNPVSSMVGLLITIERVDVKGGSFESGRRRERGRYCVVSDGRMTVRADVLGWIESI